jgi:hypothetical protein
MVGLCDCGRDGRRGAKAAATAAALQHWQLLRDSSHVTAANAADRRLRRLRLVLLLRQLRPLLSRDNSRDIGPRQQPKLEASGCGPATTAAGGGMRQQPKLRASGCGRATTAATAATAAAATAAATAARLCDSSQPALGVGDENDSSLTRNGGPAWAWGLVICLVWMRCKCIQGELEGL